MIDVVVSVGGGIVVVLVGEFLIGVLFLKSNVEFYLSVGVVLKFFDDLKDYFIVYLCWEGVYWKVYVFCIYV